MPSTATSILDGLSTSVAVKAPCVVATTVNVTLSGLQTVDSVTLVAGDRVLVKDQSTGSENGIYVVSTGSWTRAKDFDGNRDVRKGTLVIVENSGTSIFYRVTASNPIVIGTTSITFEVVSGAITQAGIGAVLYPITTAESAAGLTNANLTRHHKEGELERYGAVGDGSTNDAAAWANAALVAGQGVQLVGSSDKTYRINSDITLPNVFSFDGRGCTIKFAGGARFNRSPPSQDVSTTVASGATQSSVEVVVASAASLVIGDDVAVEATNFPRHWAKIKDIASTTITLDRALPLTITGTCNFLAYHTGTLRDRCVVENVTFDGTLASSAAADSGQVARIGGYRLARVRNCRVRNYSIADACVLLQVYRCVDAQVRGNVFEEFELQDASNAIDIQECRTAIVDSNSIHGSGFGINVTRCALAVVGHNTMSGRLAYEVSQSISPEYSTRGIKCTSCADANIVANVVEDYESPIRVDMGYRYTIVGNSVRNANWQATYTTTIAISATSNDFAAQFGNVIANNTVDYSGGEGIAIDNGAVNGIGRTTITGNTVRNCNGYGIYANDRDCTVANNIIQDWDLVAGGRFGIWYSSGANVTGNRFHHSSDNTRVCLRTFLDSGFKYVFRDNVACDGNPMFAGPLEAETSGTATIASGATTVVVTHGSIYTPTLPELTIIPGENATNDWGKWNIESIGATTFTIRVGADPGASNLDIGWRFNPKFPRTA